MHKFFFIAFAILLLILFFLLLYCNRSKKNKVEESKVIVSKEINNQIQLSDVIKSAMTNSELIPGI